jgi:hypothetical protein
MNMIKIICPKCNAEARLSLVDATYVGPRRCWKCHEFFTIRIENNRLTSCEPLTKEEYEKQEAVRKAAEKARGGIEFTSREEPATQTSFFKKAAEASGGGIEITQREEPQIPKTAPEKKQELFRPNIPHTAPKQTEPGKPGIFPPDKPSTFVPMEDVSVEPVKSPKAKEKAFRPPIPPAT